MDTFPKVVAVEAVAGKRLRVKFSEGSVRLYDCTPLLRNPVFRALNDEAFFRSVRPDPHGFGAVWSDELDLAESELWIHGTAEHAAGPAPSRPATAR